MGNGNDEIMKELRIIKKDGKTTLEKVTNNSLGMARIEGNLAVQAVKIEHNTTNITENRKEIGKVRDSVRNQLLRVAGMGGGIGAVAGYLSSLLR